MQYRQPERFDQAVSTVGFGTWNISGQWNNTDDAEAVRAVHAALEAGISLFDTAPIYGFGHAEEVLGRALVGRRDQAFIASKCGLVWTGGSKRKVRNDLSPGSLKQEIDQVLSRLRTDYLDLWQIHWPNDGYSLGDTIAALDDIRTSGKIRSYGVCNFSADRLKDADRHGTIVSHQGLYNMLERNPTLYHSINLEYRTERDIFPVVREKGMAFFPYSPLMQGLLSGKVRGPEYFQRKDVRAQNHNLHGLRLEGLLPVVEELREIAADLGVSLAQLAIAWLAAKPEVTSVIAGARTVEQITANAAATEILVTEGVNRNIEKVLARYAEFLV